MNTDAARLIRLRRLLGLAALLLFAVTWPLWGEPGGVSNPRIPWLAVLRGVPFGVDVVALIVTGGGLLALLAAPAGTRWTRGSTAAFFLGCLLLVSLDQHRLQPWVWQFLLVGTVVLLAPNRVGLACWRWIVASIYIHSAFSKLDAAFPQAHGELLLGGLLKPLGVEIGLWSPEIRQIAAALFPAGELAVGLLLLIPRTRRIGLGGSLAMHLALLWTLGPPGLNHQAGVLLWNLFFIVQNVILFGQKYSRAEPEEEAAVASWRGRTPAERCAVVLTGVFVLGPLLENWNLWDHWPAWGVYSSRPAQVRVFVDESAAGDLPAAVAPFLGRPAPLEERVPLRLDAWSFAVRKAPVYPQLRYRLALARAFLEGWVPDEAVSIEIELTPERLTGERKRLTLRGLNEVKEYSRRFRWNTGARSSTRRADPRPDSGEEPDEP